MALNLYKILYLETTNGGGGILGVLHKIRQTKHVSSACHQEVAPGVTLVIRLRGPAAPGVHRGVCWLGGRVLFHLHGHEGRKAKMHMSLWKYLKDVERKQDEAEPKAITSTVLERNLALHRWHLPPLLYRHVGFTNWLTHKLCGPSPQVLGKFPPKLDVVLGEGEDRWLIVYESLNFFSAQKSIRQYINISVPAFPKHGEVRDPYILSSGSFAQIPVLLNLSSKKKFGIIFTSCLGPPLYETSTTTTYSFFYNISSTNPLLLLKSPRPQNTRTAFFSKLLGHPTVVFWLIVTAAISIASPILRLLVLSSLPVSGLPGPRFSTSNSKPTVWGLQTLSGFLYFLLNPHLCHWFLGKTGVIPLLFCYFRGFFMQTPKLASRARDVLLFSTCCTVRIDLFAWDAWGGHQGTAKRNWRVKENQDM